MEKSPRIQIICALIEADVDALLQSDFEENLTPGLLYYREALLAYHRGDIKALQKLIGSLHDKKTLPAQEDVPCLATLLDLRLKVLKRQASAAELEEILANENKDPVWAGEILMLVAAAYETINEPNLAMASHKKAASALKKMGANGKALRAESNAVVILGHLEPERRLLPEYSQILKAAKKLRQHNIIATTLLNISREYQRMGALQNALRFCNRGIAASQTIPGGLTYFLAYAHRAHLLIDLGRFLEAETDFELARTSDFPAVKSACEVLAILMGKASKAQLDSSVLATWGERLEEKPEAKTKLSVVEEMLVKYLSEGPRGKFEITDHLFGVDLHPLTAENRLKNLIHRVRKKKPGLIVLDGDLYRIAEPEIQMRGKAKANGK